MKSKFILLGLTICLLSMCLNSVAQKYTSGVFLTAEDFENRKLSYSGYRKSEGHKIKLNDFWAKSFITVKHLDSSIRFYKRKIFGYQTYEGKIIRFEKKKELILLNPNEMILIYRHDVAKPPRGLTNVTNYYFSTDVRSPVLRLTISNLKRIFPENHVFQERLDVLFRYNTELAAYDDFHSMYKLNWIFQNSIK